MAACKHCGRPGHEGLTCKEERERIAEAFPRRSSGAAFEEDRLHPALEAELLAGEDPDAKGPTEDERAARDDRRAIDEAMGR